MKKRHRWKYKNRHLLPRRRTPAICRDCGVKMFWLKRRKKRAGRYSAWTEEQVYILPGNEPVETTNRPVCWERR